MSGSEASRQRLQRHGQVSKHNDREKQPSRRRAEAEETPQPLPAHAPTGFGPEAARRHASLLGDPRLSHSANAGPRQAIAGNLQRRYGNGYVRRLVDQVSPKAPGTFQPKLTVGPAGDKYEQEADQVAKQVVQQTSAQQTAVQRAEEEELQMKRIQRVEEEELALKRIQRVEEEEPLQMKRLQRAAEEEEPLQMKRLQRASMPEEEELRMKRVQRAGDPASLDGGDVGPDFESAVQSAAGKGNPLSEAVRGDMESAFGHDFSRVRVHTDTQADTLNRQVQALAFTTGADIFFRQGQYTPGSPAGKETLAHELTHVVQQGGAAKSAKATRKRDPATDA